tara:strand:+ start:5370 stop:5873 length:504 start_codon:yes stop_codon:yes gene_type:complete
MDNQHSRLNIKNNEVKFKDDDYETPYNILKDLVAFLEPNKIIYDPFYSSGAVIEEWKKLNYICINEKKDAFNREHPLNFDYLISNIPFSCKQKCIELAFKLNKPFIILVPIDTLGSKWIKKYFDKLEFIIPNGRLQFLKKGIQTNKCWFNTMWICYNINLPHKIIKL